MDKYEAAAQLAKWCEKELDRMNAEIKALPDGDIRQELCNRAHGLSRLIFDWQEHR